MHEVKHCETIVYLRLNSLSSREINRIRVGDLWRLHDLFLLPVIVKTTIFSTIFPPIYRTIFSRRPTD